MDQNSREVEGGKIIPTRKLNFSKIIMKRKIKNKVHVKTGIRPLDVCFHDDKIILVFEDKLDSEHVHRFMSKFINYQGLDKYQDLNGFWIIEYYPI